VCTSDMCVHTLVESYLPTDFMGVFITKNKLSTSVVAQTNSIAMAFVIFIDVFGGLLIFIYCYCLKLVVSILSQKLFGNF
jgi:hypothetical protein